MNYTKGRWVIFKDVKDYSGGLDMHIVAGEAGQWNVALIPTTWHNAEANAYLIAAAPELYEACKELEQYLAYRPAKDKRLLAYQAQLIKAIAKVEGGKK